MEIFSYYDPKSESSHKQFKPKNWAIAKNYLQKGVKSKKKAEDSFSSSFTSAAPCFEIPSYSGPVSLSDYLNNQNPVKRERKKINVFEKIAEIEDAARGHVLTFMLYTCIGLAVAGIVYGLFYAKDFVSGMIYEPLAFSSISDMDAELVDDAMKNFVFSDSFNRSIDDVGNILSEDTAVPVTSPLVSYTQPVTYSNYVVQKNDNITTITKKFGLTNVSTLIAVNNIKNVRRLQSGQKLIVPSIDGLMYSVCANDTLDAIGEKFGISIEKLVDVNDLDSSVLHVGDSLFIPGAKLTNEELKKALGELFMSPLKVSWRLSSNFGPRNDPFTGVKSNHTGIDMAAPLKSPVLASCDGKISVVSSNSVYGNYVLITHDGGYQTLYAHLYSACVKAGQNVTQGTKIGLLGSTGYSTGPHLHFTVYKNGKLINPFEVLKQ